MKALFFDTFAGISGDTAVGAMIDLGLSLEWLKSELAGLPLGAVELKATRVQAGPISATRFEVEFAEQTVERTLPAIVSMLKASNLTPSVRDRAEAVFRALARAEGRVHGISPEQVHFHEVGAIDSIVDIVGACLGVEALGVEEFLVGLLPLGSGLVDTRHGPLPVPAPATVELVRGLPCELGTGSGELVTPTGAAILLGLGARPADQTQMVIQRVGYGAGTRRLPDRPNALRLLLGEVSSHLGTEECQVLEANIDDLNPEFYEYVARRLFEAGALDVGLLPVQMKKGRPGTLLSVISPTATGHALARIILEETSTIGLRMHKVRRVSLQREGMSVQTGYGAVTVKVSTRPGGTRTVAPEYEDCARIAAERRVPLREVYQAAIEAGREAVKDS